MKWLFFLLLALAASEISAYKLSKDNSDHYEDDWDKKHLLKQYDHFKTFDKGKAPVPHTREKKVIGKMKKFDADLRLLDDDKLEHSKPVKRFRVEKFNPPTIKVRSNDARKHLKDGEAFKRTPKRDTFALSMKPDDLKMPKHYHGKVAKKPSYNIQPAKKQQWPSQYKKEESHNKLLSFKPPHSVKERKIDFHKSKLQFDKLNDGQKLMQAGTAKINKKHLDKPFFGVYGEYDELEDDKDYLESIKPSISNSEFFPTKKILIEDRKMEVNKANRMLQGGFAQMDSVGMNSRLHSLEGEFGRLRSSGNKLGESEDYMKGIQFDDGLKHMNEKLRGNVSKGEIMDGQFEALQQRERDLGYSESSQDHTPYDKKHMTGDDFQKGFGFMKDHADKFGGNNVFGIGNMMSFPGFGL